MSYDTNPYYNPEALGLKLEAQLDMTKYSYTFDIRCVWSDESGQFYTAYDSGCSCPSPFEDYTTLDSLDKVPQDVSWDELRGEAKTYGSESDYDRMYDVAPDQNSVADYLKALDTLEDKPRQAKIEIDLDTSKLRESFANEFRRVGQALIDAADEINPKEDTND